MPQMDGFEALTALRGDLATRDTPVILISAHRDEAEVVKGFSLGADDYVTKAIQLGRTDRSYRPCSARARSAMTVRVVM